MVIRKERTAPKPPCEMLATGHQGARDGERQGCVRVTYSSRDTVNTGSEEEDG